MEEHLSGPQLFLMYAGVCEKIRLKFDLISQSDSEEIRRLLKNKIKPETPFLRKCFPNAVADLEKFAIDNSKAEMWSFETVAEFWRHHHGHEDDCAVTVAIVQYSIPGADVVVESGDKIFTVRNPYGYELEPGEVVYLHQKAVIEKAKKGATAR